MPIQKNFSVWRGNSFLLPLAFKMITQSGKVPVDLSGTTLAFVATWSGQSIRKETGQPGFAMGTPSSGTAELFLTPAETRMLAQGEVRYEIEKRNSAERKTLLFGLLLVSDWVLFDE